MFWTHCFYSIYVGGDPMDSSMMLKVHMASICLLYTSDAADEL